MRSPTLANKLDRSLPTFMFLDEAAQRYGVSEEVLTQQIEAGTLEAVQLTSGEILVPAENGQEHNIKDEIIEEKFAHLRGQTVSAYGAEQKHGIRYQNFIKWARSGYIEIVNEEEGRLIEMDAADVAYCAYVYNQKKEEYGGSLSGVTIFDKEGNPYKLKHPDLSVKRRQ